MLTVNLFKFTNFFITKQKNQLEHKYICKYVTINTQLTVTHSVSDIVGEIFFKSCLNRY